MDSLQDVEKLSGPLIIGEEMFDECNEEDAISEMEKLGLTPIFLRMSDGKKLGGIISRVPLAGVIHDEMTFQEAFETVKRKVNIEWPGFMESGPFLSSLTEDGDWQKRVIQNEKMASIGRLVKVITGQLNEPLRDIEVLCQKWLGQVDKTGKQAPRFDSDLKEVHQVTNRCQKIIESLFEFSEGRGRLENLSLNHVVQTTLLLLKPVLSPFNWQLELNADEDRVQAQSDLLRQVIFNIVHNACQVSREGDPLYIRVYKANEQVVRFEVQDFGVGISDKEKIFQPFFTTKGEGEGTGLGLSLSQRIIESFRGRIHVESTVGRETIFRVDLPLLKMI